MTKPDFDAMAAKVMGVHVLDEKWSDNLAVTLCTAFDGLPAVPGVEEDESDTGWSASTNARYDFARDAITGFIAQALHAAYNAGLERAAEIAEGFDCEALHAAADIRAEKDTDHD